MTARIKGCWVAFDVDMREDDAAPLLAAIAQLKGVLAVTPEGQNPGDWIATERVRREFSEKLWAVLNSSK